MKEGVISAQKSFPGGTVVEQLILTQDGQNKFT
jgi:hypothetical protein